MQTHGNICISFQPCQFTAYYVFVPILALYTLSLHREAAQAYSLSAFLSPTSSARASKKSLCTGQEATEKSTAFGSLASNAPTPLKKMSRLGMCSNNTMLGGLWKEIVGMRRAQHHQYVAFMNSYTGPTTAKLLCTPVADSDLAALLTPQSIGEHECLLYHFGLFSLHASSKYTSRARRQRIRKPSN